MSEPIKVGDLVMQVRSCCSDAPHIGMVGTVTRVRDDLTLCKTCGQSNNCVHVSCGNVCAPGGVPMSWVKRIDPLPLTTDTPHEEEIAA